MSFSNGIEHEIRLHGRNIQTPQPGWEKEMSQKNGGEVDRRNLEADEAWREYQRTGRSVSHEAMMEWFDAWGTDKEGQCPSIES